MTPAPYVAGLSAVLSSSFWTGTELWGGIFQMVAVAVGLGVVIALIDLATARVSG
jgi:hypothetical protein